MNSKGIKQKMIKKRIKINNKDYLNYLMNNIKNQQINSNQQKSFLLSSKNKNIFQNIYPITIRDNFDIENNNNFFNDNNNLNNNINNMSNNRNKNNNIINQKNKQMYSPLIDPRLIYCIKMLGIAKYHSNFIQKKLNFEGFLALTNNDMALMNIPKNIQKLVQKFILEYLNFGSLYTLDEIKNYFSYKKSMISINNKVKRIKNEKMSHSYDFSQDKFNKEDNSNYFNQNKNNNDIFQKKNIINNFISEEDHKKNNNININGRNNNLNNKNRRINKSASPSNKSNIYNISKIQMNKLNQIQTNVNNNINNNNASFNINNIIQYKNNTYNNLNTPKMRRVNSNDRRISNNRNFSYENLSNNFNNVNFKLDNNSPINMTEVKQIQKLNSLNQNLNEYIACAKNNKIRNNSNNKLTKKKLFYNMKINKSVDNLNNKNFYYNNPLNIKNIFNDFYSDKFDESIFNNQNDVYGSGYNNYCNTSLNINPLENYLNKNYCNEIIFHEVSNKNMNTKERGKNNIYNNLNYNLKNKNKNNININYNISDNINKENNSSNSSYKLSKIKKSKDNQNINFQNYNEKNYLFQNKKSKPNIINPILPSSEKNRGMIMNNLNNYFIYNNYRGDSQHENLNNRCNNKNNYSERPIIN